MITSQKQIQAEQTNIFNNSLQDVDPQMAQILQKELTRQQDQIELIASENITSWAVIQAQGSVATNKYAEGYPGKRYYQGCEHIDELENLAIERAKKLFNCGFANVQPNSGSQANQAVFLAFLKPGDTILGMDLAAGGHLTHGSPANQSGKWFNAVHFGVDKDTHLINMDEVRTKALEHKPQLIIAGASAYPRVIDWAAFRAIADEIGAYFLVDMAHYSGLIAAGVYPSPFPHAHFVTSTTHKTLRGPRGGIILSDDAKIAKKLDSAIFPGLQGGPLEHVIAGKAVAFGEALKPEFKFYQQAVLENAKILASELQKGGVDIVSGGTDSHIVLVDLRPKGLTGKAVDEAMERAGLTCNKNTVPFDPESPFVTSGIRLGTPAGTSRGFGPDEWRQIAGFIIEVIDGLKANGESGNSTTEQKIRGQVKTLCNQFPIYDKAFA